MGGETGDSNPDWEQQDVSGHESSGDAGTYDSAPPPSDAARDVPWGDAVDAAAPDVAPDVAPDAVADAEDVPDAEEDVCDEEILEPQVLYLSADDSNSQASPVIARRLIRQGNLVPSHLVRTYEFLNYYDIAYDSPERFRVNVVPQMKGDLDIDGRYTLQIGVQGHAMDDETRRPVVLTLVLDTSGSMAGTPIDLEREVVRAIAAGLRAGDRVSAVTWSTTRDVRLDSHVVVGPDDPALLALASSLASGGGTDLHGGLTHGYDLAVRNYRAGALNRVVLVSDGQANAGVTDERLIASHASEAEREGIYLVGVGCGSGFNDTLMDTVTDWGKGAYVFIDSADEAWRMFRDRFYANLEIAVTDVRVELTLPPQLRMEEFHGEEISTVPEEVDPQHLAPNDAMVFHQYLHRCPGLGDDEIVRTAADYTDPSTGERRREATEATVAALLEGPGAQLFKGNAIVVYAEALKDVYDLHRRSGDPSAATAACEAALATVRDAVRRVPDPELEEIASLLGAYCADFRTRADARW
jgi:Ca-activated chloride channel family protein